MNETLKHRIVGAMVITALAAIFIPMLFDEAISEGNTPTNTEIILPIKPNSQLPALIKSIPQSHTDVISTEKIAQVNLQKSASVAPSMDKDLKSWVIQVGSFSSEKNANEFKDRLRKQKFNSYVAAIKSKNNTLYRLFVGPELSHEIALKTQQRLEKTFKAKTILVSK